jgi:hypothetical protein
MRIVREIRADRLREAHDWPFQRDLIAHDRARSACKKRRALPRPPFMSRRLANVSA